MQTQKKELSDAAERKQKKQEDRDRAAKESEKKYLEKKQTKEEEKKRKAEEEAKARLAGTAGASAINALSVKNLVSNMKEVYRNAKHLYSIKDLKSRIQSLSSNFEFNNYVPTQDSYMHAYANILMTKPTVVPNNIQPDPELVIIKSKIFSMSQDNIRENVLPLFLTDKKLQKRY